MEALKRHLAELTRAIDLQSAGLLGKDRARVIDARVDPEQGIVLTCMNSFGETYEVTRDDYLVGGDDGTSYVYQVRVLESLALEHAALCAALDAMEASARMLNNPPTPSY